MNTKKELAQSIFGLTSFIEDGNSRQRVSNFLIQKFECCQNEDYSPEGLFGMLPEVLEEETEEDLQYNALVIKLLVQCGVEPNSHDNTGEPVLLTAVKQNRFSIVKSLLECGADVNMADEFQKTPLIIAAQNNHTSIVFHLLEHYRNVIKVNALDISNYTALCYSVNNNNIEVCQALLDSGANPNVSNISPLFLAIRNSSSIQLIQCLVDAGASLKVWLDIAGVDFLVLAARTKRYDIMASVLNAGIGYSKSWFINQAFMTGLENDDMQVINLLVDRGVEIMTFDYKGSNILHAAAGHGCVLLLDYLLENTDIDINSQDRNGKSAFYLAAQNGHVRSLSCLLLAGVNGRLGDHQDIAPLESAILHNHVDCIKFIVSNTVYTMSTLHSFYHRLNQDYNELGNAGLQILTIHFSDNTNRIDSLKKLCVFNIREILGSSLTMKLKNSPLPVPVRNLILHLNLF